VVEHLTIIFLQLPSTVNISPTSHHQLTKNFLKKEEKDSGVGKVLDMRYGIIRAQRLRETKTKPLTNY